MSWSLHELALNTGVTYPLEVIILRMTRCQYSCAVAIRMPQIDASDVAMPSKRGLHNTQGSFCGASPT